ncbi:MAG: AAA family ATPase [SAR324 cluster bacterium]|nr:AAA family ATPase [SAR324 cluster bacterium]
MKFTIPGYTIQKEIYKNTPILVYRGLRDQDQLPVIIKTFQSKYLTSENINKLKNEYEMVKSLDHPHVIKAHEWIHYSKQCALILEDFEGVPLKEIISQLGDLKIFLQVAIQLADTMGAIHRQGLMHKDITPFNIMIHLTDDPEPIPHIKVIDFENASTFSRENQGLERPEQLQGTLAYMSPEQTGRMNREIDWRTDLYSLGVLFYEMLVGSLPFEEKDPLGMVHAHIAKVPLSPELKKSNIPIMLSRILMKMLEKNAEDRYQSGYGLKSDLEKCLRTLEAHGKITPIVLGEHDYPEHLRIPQKLYGRERELKILLDAFDRLGQNNIEMVTIAGHAGVGKTSLVHEVQFSVTRRQGYFTSGKFEQFGKNIAYSAIIQAFQQLIQQILSEGTQSIELWKKALQDALGPNGKIITDMVPDVSLLIDHQPIVPSLGPIETKNRFYLVFQNFINVFAQKEHPLVLFLDDLQWADQSSLNLLKLLATSTEINALLLICVYRENDVEGAHPIMMTLNEIKNAGTPVEHLILSPLNQEGTHQLIMETLACSYQKAKPLAEQVFQKTEGNPFFVRIFLQSLFEDKLLQVIPDVGWQWDIDKISQLKTTDNVVEILLNKIQQFTDPTQEMLKVAACLGSNFTFGSLQMVTKKSRDMIHSSLQPLINMGLLLQSGPVLYFGHDRLQQAVHSLLTGDSLKFTHLQIGRFLLANTHDEQLSEQIFGIVDHLNVGKTLISDHKERMELIRMNLLAAQKAKQSIAYPASQQYLKSGIELLEAPDWEKYYELIFFLHKEYAEIEYLVGNFEKSADLIDLLLLKARSDLEKAEIYNLLIILYTMEAQYKEAIDTGSKALSLLGVDIPRDDLPAAAQAELAEVKQKLQSRQISSLLHAPEMENPEKRAAIKLLTKLVPTAYIVDQQLYVFLVAKSIHLSLSHGNTAESSLGYAAGAALLGILAGDYQAGFELGELSLGLCERFNALDQKCAAHVAVCAVVFPWVKHINITNAYYDEGYQAGLQSGELQFAALNTLYQLSDLFFQGKNLNLLLEDVSQGLQFCKKIKHQWSIDLIHAQQLVICNLVSLTKDELSFDHSAITEEEYLVQCEKHQSFNGLCRFYIFKAQVLYLYGIPTEALKCLEAADMHLSSLSGTLPVANHNFYQSLILTALYFDSSPEKQQCSLEKLSANQEQMKIWVENCPENFLHEYLLVEAEIARITGKNWEAADLFDHAIISAQEEGFVQLEALANELAAQFWLSKHKSHLAKNYLTEAYYCYQSWGAKRKVQLFIKKHSDLLDIDQSSPVVRTSMSSGSGAAKMLDYLTALKASQAISSEINLDKLLDKMVSIVVENTGAQRGMLILNREKELTIAAGAHYENPLQQEPLGNHHNLAKSVVYSVLSTRKSVVLSNAATDGLFSSDTYVKNKRPKSILCFPIVYHDELFGIFYLENNLVVGAFTEERFELLKMLASQIAVSIENASLYKDMEKRVERRTKALTQTNKELRETQAQLVQSGKLASIGQLAAGVAHELNQPLMFIRTPAQLEIERGRENFDPDSAFNTLKMVVNATGRMGAIIKHLTDFSRRSDGMAFMPVKLEDVLEKSFLMVNELFESANIEIKKGYLSNQSVVSGNANQLEQVFINLLLNARDALKKVKNPQLTITTEHQHQKIVVRFEDNGTGIPQSIQNQIFDPFFTTKEVGEGTGLGLSISYGIIRDHKGKIELSSVEKTKDTPGKTIFTITLPPP